MSSLLKRFQHLQQAEISIDEVDIVLRALALRKRRLIGCLWAEEGRYFISESEYNVYGSRVRVLLKDLKVLVEAVELESPVELECLVSKKKPPNREARSVTVYGVGG